LERTANSGGEAFAGEKGLYFKMRLKYLICPLLLLLLWLASRPTIERRRWDGCYLQTEFQIRFEDKHGRVLTGVRLTVEDSTGSEAFYYPVTDYYPGSFPTTSDDGFLCFHHVTAGKELSGDDYYLFGIYCYRRSPRPHYLCKFLIAGKEIYRVPFNDGLEPDRTKFAALREQWNSLPQVTRAWEWPRDFPAEHRRFGENQETFTVIKKTITITE
jgi:hypothetical protein